MTGSLRYVWESGNKKPVSHFQSPYTREESVKRAADLVGKPFEQLPGKPPQHQVLTTLSDGSKVRVSDVETVFNDWLMAEYVDGPGCYEEACRNDTRPGLGPRQLEILELAKGLYRKPGTTV